MKVLIAEDNSDDRGLLRCCLEQYGCDEVVEARDGEEGLALAMAHGPDLIISDALMPRMDGFQFLRAVKMDEALKTIPFIFYSAVYTGYKEEELALSLGAEAFVVKPKEPEELWEAITAILEAHTRKDMTAIGELKKEDEEFIRSYGNIVTTKLEEKIRELEAALTRRKEAEDALRDQFTAINTIFESISAIVFVADLEEDRLLFLNRHGRLLFGDDWKGRICAEFIPEEHREDICSVKEHSATQLPFTWEFCCTQTGRWYQCMERVIPWTDGRPVRLAIAFDISERKEVERVKDEMISAVSHEMRTPLTAMLGFTEFMLENEVAPPQQREYLQIIHQETEKLNELIGNFLSLQRLQARQDKVAGFLSVDIERLLEETASRYRLLALGRRITVNCPPDLPPVLGDGRDLHEMLDNLVSNAIKFSPGGGEVHLEAGREGDNVAIRVRDEGIGIPADMLEKIFERFYQVDGTDRRKFNGTGLGLALVRDVVSVHGGRVWAESAVGTGSTFHVLLPHQTRNPLPAEP